MREFENECEYELAEHGNEREPGAYPLPVFPRAPATFSSEQLETRQIVKDVTKNVCVLVLNRPYPSYFEPLL